MKHIIYFFYFQVYRVRYTVPEEKKKSVAKINAKGKLDC